MLISIIIPAYNVENYIEECVHSAFAQTHQNIEVICVDNNSIELTWKKLEHLKQQYPQLIIDKELNPGAPAARNKGLQLSKGHWLQFLDADDLLMPAKIKHQVSLINEHNQDIPFIAATCLKRDLEGNEQKTSLNKEHPFKSLFATQLGITSSNLWNRQYIEKINGWDESLKSSQEADLMFRLLKEKNEVIYDDEPLTIVRERTEGQISQGDGKKKWERYIDKRVEILNWIKENKPELYETRKKEFQNIFFEHLRSLAQYDIESANRYYQKVLGKDFQLITNSKKYKFFFNLLGFKNTEKLINRLNSK